MAENYLVTGSSGFIGTHVCAQAGSFLPPNAALHGLDLAPPPSGFNYHTNQVDIRIPGSLEKVPFANPTAIIHLAAHAEVVVPLEEVGTLSLTNVNGTAHLLAELKPHTFVFASSSAVYGSAKGSGVRTDFDFVKPVGTYGVSKLFGEMVCSQWCREKSGSAVAFRFGNVIGPRCRGLIPYLVRHALTHPEGDCDAQCRGRGLIVRDYVPVDHIVQLLWTTACKPWKTSSFQVFNAGTGHGMTNGDVGHIVTETLQKHGHRLNVRWDAPLCPGESTSIVLDIDETVETFGIPPPTQDEVVKAVQDAAVSWLQFYAGVSRTNKGL